MYYESVPLFYSWFIIRVSGEWTLTFFKMRLLIITAFFLVNLACANIPSAPKSLSPDGKFYAVMDIDRDPKISPEWKGDSFPKIEITQKSTGEVLASIEYFGSPGSDARPLREHVHVNWRPDGKAFGITIDDRFYSSSVVYILNKEGKFVPALLPTDYEKLTGFPAPDVKHLRPRGRNSIVGWDKEGHLIYSIFLSPLPSFIGNDPLQHRIYLEVTPTNMTVAKVEQEKGEWRNGDWIPTNIEQGVD